MVNVSKLTGLILLLVVLGACMPVVHTDFDRAFNFSGLKNYALLVEEQPDTSLAMLDGSLVGKRITQSLNDVLQARGYAQSSSPDFYVAYQLGTKTEYGRGLGLRHDFGYFGYFGYFGGDYGHGIYNNSFYEEYEKAVLVVRVYKDRNKSVLLWRGLSEKRLQNGSTGASYIDRFIHQMVTGILKKFPPKNK